MTLQLKNFWEMDNYYETYLGGGAQPPCVIYGCSINNCSIAFLEQIFPRGVLWDPIFSKGMPKF